jgi:hypothetical protein
LGGGVAVWAVRARVLVGAPQRTGAMRWEGRGGKWGEQGRQGRDCAVTMCATGAWAGGTQRSVLKVAFCVYEPAWWSAAG